MNITISFDNLIALGSEQRLPLTALDLDENDHVHGELKIQIGERFLPIEGFWGSEDVCINSWITGFENIIELFDSAEKAVYTIDEGGQGLDAYLFEKKGDNIYFTLVDSIANDSDGHSNPVDPKWQRIEFSYEEFKSQILLFKELFFSEIKKAAPAIAEKWIEHLFEKKPKYWEILK